MTTALCWDDRFETHDMGRGGLYLPAAGLVLVLMNIATIVPLWPGNIGLVQAAVALPLRNYGVPYATGRIVLFAPHGSPLQLDAQAAGLQAALAGKRIRRFAIANPEHAPYGRAAEQALRKLGLWDALQGKLVLGENVSQAAQFAGSGSAQGGIFAYSLALSPGVAKLGRYVLLPESLHQPLRQRMVLIKGAGETARRFYEYLQQPAARKILTQYGFALPGEPAK